MVDGRLAERGDLPVELVLGDHQTSISLPPSTRISEVCTEAFPGFSHRYCPAGLNNTLLFQGCVLENGSGCGNHGQNVHCKGRGEKALVLLGSRSRVHSGHIFLTTCSNNGVIICYKPVCYRVSTSPKQGLLSNCFPWWADYGGVESSRRFSLPSGFECYGQR